MTHRERLLKTLSHEEPDRVPLDLGGTNVTSYHVEVGKKLREHFGLPGGEEELCSYKMQTAIPDDKILTALDVDTRILNLKTSEPLERIGEGTFKDEWGIVFKGDSEGRYLNFASHPIENPTIEDLDRYAWPDPSAGRRVEGLAERARDYGGEYALVLEGTRETVFGLASWLRGLDRFYMDLVMHRDFVEALLDRLVDFWKRCMDFVHGVIGEYVDVVKVADDLGTQRGLLISPQTYREIVKPRQAELYRYIRELFGCRLLLHCDGAVREIIPDFIEMGVDALNPVQPGVEGMDPADLKAGFGDDLVFWGGGVDTQSTLSFGSPDEVREEVLRRVEAFKPGGGYVFSQVHNIQPEVPLENILAMFEAYREAAPY